MDKKQLDHFKNKLLKLRQEILNSRILHEKDDLYVDSDDLADEADLAATTIAQQVTFQIRDREIHKLRLIDNALGRIEEGSFGYCLESGEPIEQKRLEHQPWAEYCIEVAEEREREASQRFRRA
jgi:DnaK suppressor protein